MMTTLNLRSSNPRALRTLPLDREAVAELEGVPSTLGFSTTTLAVPYQTVVGGDHKVLVLSGGETVACGEVGL